MDREKETKIHHLRISGRKVPRGKSVWSYIGKKVLSKSGETVGRLLGLRLNGNIITDFVVLKNWKLFYLDPDFVGEVSGRHVMLFVEPVLLLFGRTVFDVEGRNLGTVRAIERDSEENEFQAILIKKGWFGKSIRIEKPEIDVMKKNIILNTRYPL